MVRAACVRNGQVDRVGTGRDIGMRGVLFRGGSAVAEVPVPCGYGERRGALEIHGKRGWPDPGICGGIYHAVECVYIAVSARDVYGPIGCNRRRCADLTPCFIQPFQGPVRVQGIDVLIVIPDIDGSVRTDGRRSVPHSSPGKIRPFQCAVGIQCINLLVAIISKVKCTVRTHHRRITDRASRGVCPFEGPVWIQCIEILIVRSSVNRTVRTN